MFRNETQFFQLFTWKCLLSVYLCICAKTYSLQMRENEKNYNSVTTTTTTIVYAFFIFVHSIISLFSHSSYYNCVVELHIECFIYVTSCYRPHRYDYQDTSVFILPQTLQYSIGVQGVCNVNESFFLRLTIEKVCICHLQKKNEDSILRCYFSYNILFEDLGFFLWKTCTYNVDVQLSDIHLNPS